MVKKWGAYTSNDHWNGCHQKYPKNPAEWNAIHDLTDDTIFNYGRGLFFFYSRVLQRLISTHCYVALKSLIPYFFSIS